MSGTAKQIARKLIKQDQQSQRALPMPGPVRQFTACGGMVQLFKPAANFSVEFRILAEPGCFSRLAPEPDNFRDPAV